MKLSRVLKKRKEQKGVKILRERKGFACSEKFVCRIIFPKNDDCENGYKKDIRVNIYRKVIGKIDDISMEK